MTHTKQLVACGVVLLITSFALATAHVTHAQPNNVKERFTFAPANASTAGQSGNGRFDLVISRWSTDAERDRVFSVVTEGGAQKLPDALRDAYLTGWVRWPGYLEYTLRYARRTPLPDGSEDIVLVTDSPMWLWWDSPHSKRTSDTPFTVIHLRMSKAGAGEGKLSITTTIRGDKNAGIVLEDYANQPALLTELRHERSVS